MAKRDEHRILSELRDCRSFQWDEANSRKILLRHQVTRTECEQIFVSRKLLVADDVKHSGPEPRYHAMGETAAGRRLLVVFTIREEMIRVVSARHMSRRERRWFARGQEEAEEDS
ncbi:MAG: BrnT family toxin [Acidobacteriota bacterium]